MLPSPPEDAAVNTLGLDNSNNLKLGWGGSVDEIHFGISGIGEQMMLRSTGDLIIGNGGTNFGNASVQSFSAHGNTAGESGFSSVDTTSVAAGVGGEIAFHGKYNTGAQDWAYFGHIRGIKENATNGNTACALTFHTRPDATAPQERLRIASNGAIGLSGANYGSSGQVLTSQGSGSPVQWATPSSVTTTSGTMTIGFQDHTSGNTSSTTATGRYERIGNMVHCSIDTGSINKSGLNSGQILLLTGCFPTVSYTHLTLPTKRIV